MAKQEDHGPVKYIVDKEKYDEVLALLEDALSPKVTFNDDVHLMQLEAKENTTAYIIKALATLSNLVNGVD